MKKYRIAPEYISMWGEDATEYTILTAEQVADIARGWDKKPEDLMHQLIQCDGAAISLDNGNTTKTVGEVFDYLSEPDCCISWETIVNMMDDETVEAVNKELAPCSNADFLRRYLELAPCDLIIG